MKEIKFRGKTTNKNEWVYGFYNQDIQWDSDDGNSIDFYYIYQLSGDGEYYKKFEVIPETVGQFTGLTDKNGIEIYAGDIVINELHNEVIEVEFDVECQTCSLADIIYMDNSPIEVIGNIHDKDGL